MSKFDPTKPRRAAVTWQETPDAFDYSGEVVRVVDGDTVEISLGRDEDLGFGVRALFRSAVKIRLAGMDAKPVHTPNGDAARAWLVAQSFTDPPISLSPAKLHVVTVKNRAGADTHEKYGRYLAYLYAVDPNTDRTIPRSLNEQMIEAGLAVAWDGKGPHP